MNKKIILGAIFIAVLIIPVALGWCVYALHTQKPTATLSLLKDDSHVVNALSLAAITPAIPLAASTTLKTVESSPDEVAMNVYWLSKINELRQQKELQPISFDSRLANTAKIWAVHMGTTGVLSHDRPNGEKVSEWIKPYRLPFATRETGRAYRNTFTENIGRAYADSSLKSLEKGLEQVLTSMVNEGPEGDHYRTIFSPDWNRYGGGFYFEPVGNARVRVYMAFHYANLQ